MGQLHQGMLWIIRMEWRTESSADQAIASVGQDENADADTKEGGVTALYSDAGSQYRG